MSTQRSILIIGKSPAALEVMSDMLRQKGYGVETTNNFEDVPSRFRLEDFDLITMGGQVPPDTKAEIMQAATARKSGMLFVQGMAAIPGLVVDQIEAELSAALRDPAQAPVYDAKNRSLQLSLKDATPVIATAWWQTTFVPPNPGSDSRTLCNETLPAGAYTIPVPADIPQQASFMSLRLGSAIYCFKLAD